MEACALCKRKTELKQSHIIPRFVGKWLKSTSATGFIRGFTEPSKRLQDLRRIPMLCNTCEQRLSKLETYFSNKFFYPYLQNKRETFNYDSRLIRFVISESWRTLLVSYDDFNKSIHGLETYIDDAEETWREYLLGHSNRIEPYEHHLFFFDYIQDMRGTGVPSGFQWYMLRAVDATLVGNEKPVLSYVKFPWMMFVSSIYPQKFEGWIGTRIKECGMISQPQQIKDRVFGDFLLNRAKKTLKRIRSTSFKEIDRAILKSIERDPQRYLNSESLKVHLAEAKRTREIKKRGLPRLLVGLIEVLENALEDESLKPAEMRLQLWERSIIADTLANVSVYEALKVNAMIETTILKAKASDNAAKGTFKANEITVMFIVNLNWTKTRQRAEVAKELNKMVKHKKPGDKRYLTVFSWNPYDFEFPYESAFYLGE